MRGSVPVHHNRYRVRVVAGDIVGNWVLVASMRVPWVHSVGGSSVARAG